MAVQGVLRALRHLWDDRRTDIAIVFVGGGDCYRVLRRELILSSRVYVWQESRRMNPEQVLQVIPVFHPVWANTDPADIAYVDTHAAHGNFRAWSKITAHTIAALARLERPQPDRQVQQWVFSRLGRQRWVNSPRDGAARPRRRRGGHRRSAPVPRPGQWCGGHPPHALQRLADVPGPRPTAARGVYGCRPGRPVAI